jgi:hypothetical protein
VRRGRGKTLWHPPCSSEPTWRSPLVDLKLTLVSADADTLLRVAQYLSHFGSRISTTSRVGDAGEVADGAGADALVLFADDYPAEDVRAAVRTCAVRLAVIVTSHGAEFAALAADPPGAVIILPQPTWGWVLVEALRTGVARASTPS